MHIMSIGALRIASDESSAPAGVAPLCVPPTGAQSAGVLKDRRDFMAFHRARQRIYALALTLPMSKVNGVSVQPDVQKRAPRVNHDRILDAALVEFANRGFDRSSMAAIAARARTTKPTLYANFAGKQALYEAVVRHEAELIRDRLFATYAQVAGMSTREQLRAGTDVLFDLIGERPAGFQLYFEIADHDGYGHKIIAQTIAEVNSAVAELIGGNLMRAGRPNPRGARFVAALVVALIKTAARSAHEFGMDPKEASRISQRLLYDGLRFLNFEDPNDS